MLRLVLFYWQEITSSKNDDMDHLLQGNFTLESYYIKMASSYSADLTLWTDVKLSYFLVLLVLENPNSYRHVGFSFSTHHQKNSKSTSKCRATNKVFSASMIFF